MPLENGKRKWLYSFDEGFSDRRLLGGKGAGLCQMTSLGLPVPPGFVISTDVCEEFYKNDERLPPGLMDSVLQSVKSIEAKTGKRFGDRERPLLVSVRSGAAVSMPGMMDTILNLGLNDAAVEGLAKLTNDRRFAYDTYRRFIQLFGKIVLGADDSEFSNILDDEKWRSGVSQDSGLSSDSMKRVAELYKALLEKNGTPLPQEPVKQLELAIEAIFRSWNGKRAKEYRRQYRIGPDVARGTAVTIVAMIFGNMGNDSATGVVFTRNPATGNHRLYGDYLTNAQGEDVVAGIRTPRYIAEMKVELPEAYNQLEECSKRLEAHYREAQDIEFTIEKGKLYLLQTRAAKMAPMATIRVAVEMVNDKVISKEEALMRITPEQLEQLMHPHIDPKVKETPIVVGVPAAPGAATGRIVFDADTAVERAKQGEKVILVREETKPEDVHGFFAAVGVLTSRGGKTSHAAVVARGIGKPCIVGCSALSISREPRRLNFGEFSLGEGEMITIDGSTGNVYSGEVPLLDAELNEQVFELLSWADGVKRLGVWANADTAETARNARKMGAQGIGLVRTERMFNAEEKLPLVVSMIMAATEEERRSWLERLMPLQKEDFKSILKEMEGLPVVIRLLDPPLHEFLPRQEDMLGRINALKEGGEGRKLEAAKGILEKANQLSEANPMLGHRGIRLGLTNPEIYEMQIRAVMEAASELIKEGKDARPKIMVPQVANYQEVRLLREQFERIRLETEKKDGVKLDIKLGTMIETVRAALDADEIAKYAEFFSFGTNDLTQATFSFSREDAEAKFLPFYLETGVLSDNPFETIDEKGVGELIRSGVKAGRKTRPELEVGICGEHGGDPRSIYFCHRAGLSYVSASPFRIPVARLAAARVALQEGAQSRAAVSQAAQV
ncbi:MAG TPA: pyruvate, phosphate dikinase [Candidatus Saccharimonadales bacterium]|nr:pyruvate, phosphate dikinase [Candidatus Saccharimonadales bacterium]